MPSEPPAANGLAGRPVRPIRPLRRVGDGGPRRVPRRYADFLPEAQGLAARSASPLVGFLILTVALLFGVMVGFSAWAEVEQVVRATGQVEPVSRVRLLNHPHGGRIGAIHAREGQRVAEGEVLVAFDPELREAELDELRRRFTVKAIEAARLTAEVEGGELTVSVALATARPDLVAEQQALLEARTGARESRKEQLASGVERRERDVRTVAAEIARLRNSLTLLRQQEEAVRDLAEKGLYPRLRMVAVEQQVSDTAGELRKAEERLEGARAALEEGRREEEGSERQLRSQALAELAAANAERDRLAEAIRQQQTLLRGLVVTAPAEGIVQDIAVTSVGQSVAPHATLMKLVPVGEGLVIEARVANEDIGYLHLGQKATVKVRAFDFLRHGALSAEVAHIALDATPEPRTGALTYAITLHTERAHLGAGPGEQPVVPGMVVDLEFHIGERTILSFLTDRILQLRSEVFREG